MFMKNTFGQILKNLRTEKGLSQTALAEKLDNQVTASAIGLWELGKRTPNLDAAILIAKFFGVSLDYIAGLED